MKLETFVHQRRENWYRLRTLLDRHQNRVTDTDELVELIRLYRAVCSDYAYADSRYPHSSVVADLNTLIQRSHALIYGSRKLTVRNWLASALDDIRRSFALGTTSVTTAAAIFIAGTLLAFWGCWINPDLPNHLMGDRYVDMTIENINQNDPFAVYKGESSPLMSSFIMTNNIKVTFFAFALGCLLGLGTMYILFYNGLILGAFFHLFFKHGLLVESYFTIMIHGTIELSCIFIAGGGGLLIGKAMVFPGLLPRRQALMQNGLVAIKLLLSTVPLLFLAGLLEGFVTRLPMPISLQAVILVASTGVLWWYYGGSTKTSNVKPRTIENLKKHSPDKTIAFQKR